MLSKDDASTEQSISKKGFSKYRMYESPSLNTKEPQSEIEYDEFASSFETRNYLENEKQYDSIDGLDKQSNDKDNLNIFLPMENKRQSTVGSYLFGQDFKNLDLDKAASIISATRKTDSDANRSLGRSVDTSVLLTSDTMERDLDEMKRVQKASDEKEDEIIKLLSEHENGYLLLLARVKASINSTKEAAMFLKKRAQIEHEYATSMMKLATTYKLDVRDGNTKDGSYQESFDQFAKMHYDIGEMREKFSNSISEMAENMLVLAKNNDRSRKQVPFYLNEAKGSCK
jgi:hypothetical protein